MARAARTPKEDDTGEIKPKDFAKAVSLYRNDIKTANSEAATQNQTAGQGYKDIKKVCHIQPDAARKAFKLMDATEEAKRDDWFRGFVGLVNEMAGRKILTFEDTDLVDAMQGDDGYARPKPHLVTIPYGAPSDGTETDLADAADFDEATDEELAQQEGRPASGTGAAAIAAMKDAKG